MLKIVPTAAADVEIRRAVERIEQHAIFPLAAESRAQDHRLLVLLGRDDRDAFAAAERAQQNLVGDDVELLLLLALHVLAADRAEHVVEARAPHVRRDHLRRDRERREDPRERAGGLGVVLLLLQDVGLQRDEAVVAGGCSRVVFGSAHWTFGGW